MMVVRVVRAWGGAGVEERWRGRRCGWRGGRSGGRRCGHSRKVELGRDDMIERYEDTLGGGVQFGMLLLGIHRACRCACVGGSYSVSCACRAVH